MFCHIPSESPVSQPAIVHAMHLARQFLAKEAELGETLYGERLVGRVQPDAQEIHKFLLKVLKESSKNIKKYIKIYTTYIQLNTTYMQKIKTNTTFLCIYNVYQIINTEVLLIQNNYYKCLNFYLSVNNYDTCTTRDSACPIHAIRITFYSTSSFGMFHNEMVQTEA